MKPTRLLQAWNLTCRAAPSAPALMDAATGRVWSRQELDALADTWRNTRGASLAGQTVVFAEPNGVEWLRVFLGLLKSNAVAAALDPGEPPLSRRAIASAIGADVIWENGGLQPLAGRRRRRPGCGLLKLTSGSTGSPRAVPFTDGQMLADGRQICAAMGIGPDDINFAVIPFGHSYGLGNLVLPLLDQGTAIVCASTALPHAVAADVMRWSPTVFPAVPALLRALAESHVAAERLRSIRTVISAGAPLSPEVAAAFYTRFRKKIHNFYGSTETGGISYDGSGAATLAGRSVGRPLPGVRLHSGRGGRFHVSSAAVFTRGNRLRAGRKGKHRMADIGERTASGELVLLGRASPLIKVSGRRFSLLEVERALRQLPGVRDVFVTLQPGQSDRLAAAVASERPVSVLKAALRDRLSPWKMPRTWAILPEFPRTARGKIDRGRLLEQLRRPGR